MIEPATAQAALHYASVPGGRMAYRTEGDPTHPALVFIHGWCSYSGVWEATIAHFKDDYYCIAPDLLGLGDSDKPADADYGLDAQVGRILALLDSLKISQFIVVGHSHGGQIVLTLASRTAPDRVLKVIDIGGVASGKLSDTVMRVIYPALRLLYLAPVLGVFVPFLMRIAPIKRYIFHTWFHDDNLIFQPHFDHVLDYAIQPGIRKTSYLIGRAIIAGNLTAELQNIKVPTLVLFGQDDETVPVSEGKLVLDKVPGSTYISWAQCGHFPMYEKTDLYLVALDSFLSV